MYRTLVGTAEHHLTFPETILSDSNRATRQRKQTEQEAERRLQNFNNFEEKKRFTSHKKHNYNMIYNIF